jgi:hypothetical protein
MQILSLDERLPLNNILTVKVLLKPSFDYFDDNHSYIILKFTLIQNEQVYLEKLKS